MEELMAFFDQIAENANLLNKNDNEILSYCIRNHEQISRMKVQDLAARLYTSPASVIRFCKKLGFSGFSEFKAALKIELRRKEGVPGPQVSSIDFLKDIDKAIHLIQEDMVEQVLDLIRSRRHIELFAVGSSRMVASEFAKRLRLAGKQAFYYDDSSLMNISARQLTGDDLVIALSVSGESSLVIAAANMAKSCGAPIVSITNLGSNTLSDMADISLYVHSTRFSQADVAVRSRVQMLILCEYLFFRFLET